MDLSVQQTYDNVVVQILQQYMTLKVITAQAILLRQKIRSN